MPMFLDIHVVKGATGEQVANAHVADVAVQDKYNVKYLRYWFNGDQGKIYCLCDAPDAETARKVHQEAHGLLAEKIIRADPELVEEFLGGGIDSFEGAVLEPGGKQLDTGLRTVLFTDIVGSTDLTQRLGDRAALAVLEEHDVIARGAITANQGREVKHTGDGIMAAFRSASAAMRCATQIQRALAERNAGGRPWPLQVRIGAAVGEPVEHNNDMFGTTVQLAARLCAHAQPQEVLVSREIAEACSDEPIAFEYPAEVSLKGFEQPQAVTRLRWAAGPATA